jgi:hypothetical protein
VLHDTFTQLDTDFGRFLGVSALPSAAAEILTLSEEISAVKTKIAQNPSHQVVKQLSIELSQL